MLTQEQKQTIRAAADELDAAWDFDAARGLRDSRPGSEYERRSLAPKLREIAEEEEGQ